MPGPDRPRVRVTEIGEYIRHNCCERRFRLDHADRALAKQLPFFDQLSSSMDPALQEAGRQREAEWEAQVRAAGLLDLCAYAPDQARAGMPWAEFAARAAALAEGQAAYGRELLVEGPLGAFQLAGRTDFVLVLWRDGRPVLRIVECKANRRDKTAHRVQVAIYRLLLRDLLAQAPLVIAGRPVSPEEVECVIARIDAETNAGAEVLALDPLELSLEEADVAVLLREGGTLAGLLTRPLDDLDYRLGQHCGDCVFTVHCFPESARRRRLELLGIEPAAARALRAEGVGTLDDLAALAPTGDTARRVRARPGFGEDLEWLAARARARLTTLPVGREAGRYQVEALPHAGASQLPPHEADGHRLVRVYVAIDFDYVENRIGALTAHVTASDGVLDPAWTRENGRSTPDPDVRERLPDEAGGGQTRPMRGEDLVGVPTRPWTGDADEDARRETDLIQRFFRLIVEAVRRAAGGAEAAPIHFYVWSRREMERLLEACSRCDTRLLHHLRELLGCRPDLEQLIFSCLEDEVHRRFAIGWTGKGLIPAVSVPWYGRSFHWTRRVNDGVVALDRVFEQDLFDFRAPLRFDERGWRDRDDRAADSHRFEVRALFQDGLPAPYWRAYWGTLPDPSGLDVSPKLREALRRYRRAGGKGLLKAYLATRVQALRWLDERQRYKNERIVKPPLRLADLPEFTLGVEDPARAARDFLVLDYQVRLNDWLAAHLAPPLKRVPEGLSLPVREVRPIGANRLVATLDPAPYGLGLADLAVHSTMQEGSFVRVTALSGGPGEPQTGRELFGGSTASVKALDWETGRVELGVIPGSRGGFIIPSRAWTPDAEPLPAATLDASPTDYVGNRVEKRLATGLGDHACCWFDPTGAEIPTREPLAAAERARYRRLVGAVGLASDQVEAVVAGLDATVQLLQGPPGTGKTQTTAVALLLRVLHARRQGDIVLVTAHTHTAVDEILNRVAAVLPRFQAAAEVEGLTLPRVVLARIDRSGGPGVRTLDADSPAAPLREMRAQGVVIAGGTTSGVLKVAEKVGGPTTAGFQVPTLIVDEASMLVFPSFLATATLVEPGGEILLAGDHRQLAPIVAHDWEREDRPPTVIYQPYVSAYEAVLNLKELQGLPDCQVTRSALRYSFRLPPPIRDLLTRLYERDAITLEGRTEPCGPADCADPWEAIWGGSGVFLVLHGERESKEANETEAELLADLLACGLRLGAAPAGSVGLVMPHRAQRALLRARLAAFTGDGGPVDVLDTVERLQGGERETILVSATASDPAAISARADFILNLNRANVAFSRAKRRLVVVCAESLLSHIPAEGEQYQAAVLWKSLRGLCSAEVGSLRVAGHDVRVTAFGPGGVE